MIYLARKDEDLNSRTSNKRIAEFLIEINRLIKRKMSDKTIDKDQTLEFAFLVVMEKPQRKFRLPMRFAEQDSPHGKHKLRQLP